MIAQWMAASGFRPQRGPELKSLLLGTLFSGLKALLPPER
jgi:hypothetical protein